MDYTAFVQQLYATDEAGAEAMLTRLERAFDRVDVVDASSAFGRSRFECYVYDSPRTGKSYVYAGRSRAEAILGAAEYVARHGDMPGVAGRPEVRRIPPELVELFQTDPTVARGLMFYLTEGMPLEQALILTVKALAAERTAVQHELTTRVMNEPPQLWRRL